MKLLFTILTIVSSHTAFSTETDQSLHRELDAKHCNRPAVEVEAINDVFEACVYSDVLVQLLSGNSKEAGESLGGWLAIKVIFLGNTVKHKPCKIQQEMLNKIYSILRVVAAVHEKTPISA